MEHRRNFYPAFLTTGGKLLISLLVIAAAATFLRHEFFRVKQSYQLKKLGQAIPTDYSLFFDILEKEAPAQPDQLVPYLEFYRLSAKYFPDLADSYGLLGFCYYHLNKEEEALNYYQKAADLDRHFLIYPFNEGIISFQKKDYPKARQALEIVIARDANKALEAILQASSIYHEMIQNRGMTYDDLVRRVGATYREAYELLVAIYVLEGDYPRMKEAAQGAIDKRLDTAGRFAYFAGLVEIHQGAIDSALSMLPRHIKVF